MPRKKKDGDVESKVETPKAENKAIVPEYAKASDVDEIKQELKELKAKLSRELNI